MSYSLCSLRGNYTGDYYAGLQGYQEFRLWLTCVYIYIHYMNTHPEEVVVFSSMFWILPSLMNSWIRFQYNSPSYDPE